MTCDKVIIIHRGRVAASGAVSELTRQAGEASVLLVEAEGDIDVPALRGEVKGISEVVSEPIQRGARLRITTVDPDDVSHHLCMLATRRNWRLRELRPHRQTLEDMFVRLTGADEPAAQR
jgi:ABC-2 type transport system ATP-binding protein